MSKKDIKVPNIGEFKDVEVIEVLIKKGQKIKKNDPLITIESDKSSVEIPSSDDGTIISLNVKIGDKVSEGDKIIEIESEKEIKDTSAQELPKNQLPEEIKKNDVKKVSSNKEIDNKIIEILDEYIKPAVEQDGGAIQFESFEKGTVKVSLQGACSGCPSSMITLKSGIEKLLKRFIPEVEEVVAEGV